MLCQEVGDSPFKSRQQKILEWVGRATVFAEITEEVIADAADLMSRGLREADSLHLACAKAVDCDWFFTTDRGILKKVKQFGVTRVANPVEFVVEE